LENHFLSQLLLVFEVKYFFSSFSSVMSGINVTVSLSGAGKVNFSVAFDSNLTTCDKINVEGPSETNLISDAITAAALTNPVPSCSNEQGTHFEGTKEPVFSVELSDSRGNVGSVAKNVTEFDDDDIDSVLFGGDWRNINLDSFPSPDITVVDEVVILGEFFSGIKSEST
jgi:hypothetical protein